MKCKLCSNILIDEPNMMHFIKLLYRQFDYFAINWNQQFCESIEFHFRIYICNAFHSSFELYQIHKLFKNVYLLNVQKHIYLYTHVVSFVCLSFSQYIIMHKIIVFNGTNMHEKRIKKMFIEELHINICWMAIDNGIENISLVHEYHSIWIMFMQTNYWYTWYK